MLAMGWFTMGAGLLPGPDRLRGRGELLMLAAYGFLAAFAYGTVMNLARLAVHGRAGLKGIFRPGPARQNLARFSRTAWPPRSAGTWAARSSPSA